MVLLVLKDSSVSLVTQSEALPYLLPTEMAFSCLSFTMCLDWNVCLMESSSFIESIALKSKMKILVFILFSFEICGSCKIPGVVVYTHNSSGVEAGYIIRLFLTKPPKSFERTNWNLYRISTI